MKKFGHLSLPYPEDYTVEKQSILEKIYCFPYWRQRIPLDDKAFTPGYITDKVWETSFLPEDLSGNSFLDIGANDGLISFLAEQKGASPVFATDLYTSDLEKGSNRKGLSDQGIKAAKAFLKSNVEIHSMDFFRLGELERSWDIVYISNVLLWLKDPHRALTFLSELTDNTLFIRNLFMTPTENGYYNFNPQKGTYDMDLSYAVVQLKKAGFKNVRTEKIPSYQKVPDIHFPMVYIPKGTISYSTPRLDEALGSTQKGSFLPITGQLGSKAYLKKAGWVDESKLELVGFRGKKGIIKEVFGPQTLQKWKQLFQKERKGQNLYILIAEK